jgi:hypothetical protein
MKCYSNRRTYAFAAENFDILEDYKCHSVPERDRMTEKN